ncbi:NADH-ubiquinone oxidoreductase chain 3 [Dissostichus eleginoides]|uniref:NADH-ubiquinone oxidoreductase chain 3 n=1 Tax=Dissostichus eleginoides TaxID=100907 RepID=A0AAD9BI44_DISEL|nr:NADH-ubiquinone oxidoreductase chain 3 [Dissostichus eleginoides]
MDLTFALRRKEVVESEPAISEIVERWPFSQKIRCAWSSIGFPRLIEIFRSKRGNVGQLLTQLSQHTQTTEPTDMRTLVLRGLPIILGDNPTDFYKVGFDTDDEDSFRDIDIGILLVEHEGAGPSSSLHRSPASLKIILEGQVVIDNIQDLPKAICILFGLTYALHLNYPKTMMLTFQFIQKVILTLGQDELKPRLQTLKNQLTM